MNNKVIIITGAARGIGLATSRLFASRGARVAVWDRDAAAVAELVAELEAQGAESCGEVVDVTDREALDRATAAVVARWGRIDVLINNAGITLDARVEKMTEDQFDRVIGINLKGTFNCAQAVIPQMIAQGGGRILNASSIVGLTGNFGQTNYAASKSGVIGMTRTWARELGRHGITVNAIAPGFIKTEMTAAMPEKVLTHMKDRTPLGRLGLPEDVARLYLFLASEDACFITGQVVGVDGGLVL